jgi:shikimate dehydrogenase
VYRPLETKLLKSAKMRGNLVVDGIGMLLYQAVSGFNIWFGIKPDVTKELKAHVLKNL